MSERINVLVYPDGAENALEVHLALKDVMNIRLFGASGREDHGGYVYLRHLPDVPFINDTDFAERFNELLRAHDIHVVIPTHDDVALAFARLGDRVCAKVAVPGLRQAEICRSKRATYALFAGADFIPRTFAALPRPSDLPVFVKPDDGQGGKGAFLAERPEDLERIGEIECPVICEHLPGKELTVDCFSDRHGVLRFIGPRSRDRVFGGISVRSTTVPLSHEIRSVAERIHAGLKPRGLWYFQLKQDDQGRYKLLEVSVRTAGTMSLYRCLGVNFPLLTVYDLLDRDVAITVNDMDIQVDRALFNRYRIGMDFDTVYVDYDDTITNTQDGRVNAFVMMFLYNMKNSGRRIKLITKHRFELDKDMERYCIHKGLFDEILHIAPNASKAACITAEEKAIFIDNAYKERAEVKAAWGIPVFDVDAIGALIDWKE
jgi:hypothetical protein